MQGQNYNEYQSACSEYFNTLNRVNLLLLKEHNYRLEKSQYQEELDHVNRLIDKLEHKSVGRVELAVQKEWDYLQQIIKSNKKEISMLRSKLEPRESMINELQELKGVQQKYWKLISPEYQNAIQLKLSMIKGKVDDLKKKIKEINKDILAYQQEHTELIDEHSFELKRLETYEITNQQLREQIHRLKAEKRK